MKGKRCCGFCHKDAGHDPAERGGLPICDTCRGEWNKCFPPTLTPVNNLSIIPLPSTKGEVMKPTKMFLPQPESRALRVPTGANFIFCTGDKDALRVQPNDRRFMAIIDKKAK